jgi:hypothetical protein
MTTTTLGKGLAGLLAVGLGAFMLALAPHAFGTRRPPAHEFDGTCDILVTLRPVFEHSRESGIQVSAGRVVLRAWGRGGSEPRARGLDE